MPTFPFAKILILSALLVPKAKAPVAVFVAIEAVFASPTKVLLFTNKERAFAAASLPIKSALVEVVPPFVFLKARLTFGPTMEPRELKVKFVLSQVKLGEALKEPRLLNWI